jgi:hypothetical protein
MQTQRVTNGHTGRRPGFRFNTQQREAMSRKMKASWARRRAAQTEADSGPSCSSMSFTPKEHVLDQLTRSFVTPSPTIGEIDTLIAVRQTELDALRTVRGLLLDATESK